MLSKWDTRFIELAQQVSTWSKDPSTKVGAVIVDDKRHIVSVGFNGFPQRMPDNNSFYEDRDEKYSRIIHGEMNALAFAERSVKGCTLYTVPFMPCDRCFVFMVQVGIKKFVFPQASPEQNTRWGTSFNRVRKYAEEMGVELIEVPL
jgi:dCMP deaminase